MAIEARGQAAKGLQAAEGQPAQTQAFRRGLDLTASSPRTIITSILCTFVATAREAAAERVISIVVFVFRLLYSVSDCSCAAEVLMLRSLITVAVVSQ